MLSYTSEAMSFYARRIGPIFGAIHAEYRQLANRYFGKIERFSGSAEEICEQIIHRLWAGDFYRTSLGHYNFFWIRDFGTVSQSLTALGHVTRVHHTLRWALRHYRKADRITTCIDKRGHTFNAPGKPSIDALPWLLHAITVSNYVLNTAEKEFLSRQLHSYSARFLDKNGDIRPGVKFAEMRDAVYYDRSAYALSLVGRLAACVRALHIPGFDHHPEQYTAFLIEHYWNGSYFNADRSNGAYSSDSALMPFFLGIVDDANMAQQTLDYINKKRLNRPYPLQYSEHDDEFVHRLGMGKWLMPNYTGTTLWTWHATFYLHILKRYRQPEYAQQYRRLAQLIERHGSYPELVNPDGSWYNAPIYRSDPGMQWAALFLELEFTPNQSPDEFSLRRGSTK